VPADAGVANVRGQAGAIEAPPSPRPFAPNPPFIPEFAFPAVVKGYTPASLAGFAETSCPPKDLKRGESLLVQVVMNSRVDVSQLTPAFVRLTRPDKPDHSLLVLLKQYVLTTGSNQFHIPLDFPAGAYQLSFGFYAKMELVKEYPKLYARFCDVTLS
jgi:hypothetical protein